MGNPPSSYGIDPFLCAKRKIDESFAAKLTVITCQGLWRLHRHDFLILGSKERFDGLHLLVVELLEIAFGILLHVL